MHFTEVRVHGAEKQKKLAFSILFLFLLSIFFLFLKIFLNKQKNKMVQGCFGF